MNATQLTALITPIVSAVVLAVIGYFQHKKTRKVSSNVASVIQSHTQFQQGMLKNNPPAQGN